ncbi:MAG: hypothetical protein J5449_03360 [Oscillospiraceae bacterium]|nr:hypothetical protein [Oscillospiraceae bacterium]
MKRYNWIVRLVALMLASYLLLAVSVLAAGTPGSESDPLVTLSYLNDTFLPQLLTKVDEKLAERDRALSDKLDAKVSADAQRLSEQYGAGTGQSGGSSGSGQYDTFTVVTLSQNQTLYGEIGCEVMLRVGSAVCVTPSTPGLIDETDGSTLGGGKELAQNHLYMMTIDDRGVKATAATVKLLVRGGYTIK